MAKPVIIVKAVHEIGRILGGFRHEIEIDGPMTVTEFVALLSARYGEEFRRNSLQRRTRSGRRFFS